MPDISVIIPTFRRPSELVEAIESVLAQGVAVDIHVIDDSPEHSAAPVVDRFADKFADRTLTYHAMPEPSGGRPALVRNYGLSFATADIVHCLDDDDRVPAGHYGRALGIFRSRPNIGVVFGRIRPFGEGDISNEVDYFTRAWNRSRRLAKFGPRWGFVAGLSFLETPLVCSAGLVRRDIIRAIGGFDPQIPIAEDVEFFARAVREGGAVLLDDDCLHYRIGPSIMRMKDRSEDRLRAEIYEAYQLAHEKYRQRRGAVEFFAVKAFAALLGRFFHEQPYRVEMIETTLDLIKLMPEWQKLFETTSPRVPARSPLWCITWWNLYRRDNLIARDSLRVYVLRDAAGNLKAVAPMMLTSRPGIGPVQSREMQFIGADPYVSQLRGVCCRGEDASEVFERLSAAIASDNGYDWVQWRGLPETLPAGEAERFESNPQLRDIDCIVPLNGNWDSYVSTLPRRTRKKLRKVYRDLEDQKIGFEFKVLTEAGSLDAALDDFLVLHQSRAELDDVTEHPNVFSTGKARDFLARFCAESAHRDNLRIFQLVVGDKVVATRIGFQFNDEMYLYFSGFDPDWGKYSIMTVLVAEIFKWAFDNGIGLINLSSGIDRSKTRWNPTFLAYQGGYSPRPTTASTLKYRVVSRLRHRNPGATSAAIAASDETEGDEARADGA